MKANAQWPKALEAARRGDLAPALEAHRLSPAGPMTDYFEGRALAEAGVELEEAEALLRQAQAAEPANPLTPHVLALALARAGSPAQKAEAAAIWRHRGLPHDLDLLGQVAFTLEEQNRPWPATSPAAVLPWPESLPLPEPPPPADSASEADPAEADPGSISDQAEGDQSQPAPGDKLSRPAATKSLGYFQRRKLSRALGQMEKNLMSHHALEVLQEAHGLLAQGIDLPDLHLLAGLAAEEAGDARRARAHLACATQLDQAALLARTTLARVYWRCGWVELAIALWRSLPVEGPYDYGRHYHLALGHYAAGDRPAALAAMRIALDQFYTDTLHFYIKRALWLWQAHQDSAEASGRPPQHIEA